MKISTLNSKLNLISVGTNAKTRKGDDDEHLTSILYLAPAKLSGYEVCPHRSDGCTKACLFTSGRGAMTSVQQARLRKTKLFFENRTEFIKLLKEDLNLFQMYCKDSNLKGYVRLNGTSDIDWSLYIDMNNFSYLFFYDYTKDIARVLNNKNPDYKLTFSKDETTDNSTILAALTKANVAVVFETLPSTYIINNKVIPVIEGDLTDLRYNDPIGIIVGLKAKGLAKKDTTGFVVKQVFYKDVS